MILSLVAAFMIAQADAGTVPLPDYDVERICRSDPSYSAVGYVKACIDIEQTAYNSLKLEWPTLNDQERRWSIARAESHTTRIKYRALEDQVSIIVTRHEYQRGPSTFQK